MREFIKKYRIEIFVFLLALAARLVFFSFSLSHNHGDIVAAIKGDDGYYEISQNLIHGNGFSFDIMPPYRPNPLRPPVWPFVIAMLAAVFKSYWAVFVFEVVVGSLIPVLAMHIVRRMFPGKGVWLSAGIILALEPYGVFLSTVLYTETAFTALFLLFFLFLQKYFADKSMRNLVWMTMFMALATLVKPTIQYVPVLLGVGMIIEARKALSKRVFGHAVLMIALFGLVISPWIYRNYREWGVVGMSAQPAFNLYVYLVPTVLSIDNHTNFATEYQSFVKQGGFDENSIDLGNSAYYSAKALSVIKEHKLALAESAATTLITFFTHDGMLTFLQYAGHPIGNELSKPALSLFFNSSAEFFRITASYALSPAVLVIIVRLLWILVALFMIAGWALMTKRRLWTPATLSALVLVLYFAATTGLNGLGVNARFRVPVNAFIVSFALYGLLSLKRDNTPDKRQQ